jgi:hypothetical protein
MGKDDLFHKRKARQARDLTRRKEQRAPYDRVLIVSEGEKTEPNYFKELRDYYKLNSANVEVTGDCGSGPMSVVNHALKLYRESLGVSNAFDRVFCVFDRDTHGDYQQALDTIARLKPRGVFTAINSVPCFEYWLLLHFTHTDKPFHATGRYSVGDMVKRELKRYWPVYEKAMSGSFLHCVKQLDFAKTNAARALKSAQANGNDNPSTRVHELVEYLQSIKTKKTES